MNFNNKFLKWVLIIFLSFITSLNYSIADNNLNISILNSSDVKIYKQIFKLQSKQIRSKKSITWKKIEKLKKKINNKILIGTLNADKYLHPTGWRSSYKELKDWLHEYHDHPDAYKIHRLAIRRKPARSKSPKKPTGNFLNGYGNISKDLIKPTFPLATSRYKRDSFIISIKVRRAIRRKNLEYVENLLSLNKTQKKLTNQELAQLRAELSHAYFIFKKYKKSLRQARISISLSGHNNALAFWSGGLSSWRLENLKLSKWFFNKLSDLNHGPESILSAGSFWSAKVSYHLGEYKNINKYLYRAIKYDRTFYSTLSKASLGYQDNYDFKLEKISKRFILKLKSFKAGRRILALIQISEFHKASREFRKIIFNFDEKEYPEIVSFASKNNMPGFAFRLSAILRNDHNKILLGGLYPVPDWDFKSLPIKDKSLLFSISRQESGFNPRAKSYANALGLMQVLPSTASFIMKDRAYRKKEILYDEDKNLYVASKYIQFLLGLDIVKQDVSKMLASYNAGPGNFSKWSKSFHKTEIDPIFMIETLPARQTRNYIKLVLTNLWIYKIRLKEKPNLLFKLASGNIPKYEFKDDR